MSRTAQDLLQDEPLLRRSARLERPFDIDISALIFVFQLGASSSVGISARVVRDRTSSLERAASICSHRPASASKDPPQALTHWQLPTGPFWPSPGRDASRRCSLSLRPTPLAARRGAAGGGAAPKVAAVLAGQFAAARSLRPRNWPTGRPGLPATFHSLSTQVATRGPRTLSRS